MKTDVFYIPLDRRRFLKALAIASAGFSLPGYLAEALTFTPEVAQGPYYPFPRFVPLDKDNDLLHLNDNLTAAAGVITYISGRVLDANGSPVKGALVELWHADRDGDYIFEGDMPGQNPDFDVNFAGFGQFLTGSGGYYKFRTIKAGLYTDRTRHFHFGVTLPGQLTRRTTQLFWNETAIGLDGNPWPTQNNNDYFWTGITDPDQRASVTKDYVVVDQATGAIATNWDIVMNFTPVEPGYPNGSFVISGMPVPGPTNSMRFKLTFPAYTDYTYEVYSNPTLANVGNTLTNWTQPFLTNMGFAALPFALSDTGTINTNRFTSTTDGALSLFVEQKSAKGFYYVSFRVPGANKGTP
jgi:protocatechuate 3,4-dioxygenase beta subunit